MNRQRTEQGGNGVVELHDDTDEKKKKK